MTTLQSKSLLKSSLAAGLLGISALLATGAYTAGFAVLRYPVVRRLA